MVFYILGGYCCNWSKTALIDVRNMFPPMRILKKNLAGFYIFFKFLHKLSVHARGKVSLSWAISHRHFIGFRSNVCERHFRSWATPPLTEIFFFFLEGNNAFWFPGPPLIS